MRAGIENEGSYTGERRLGLFSSVEVLPDIAEALRLPSWRTVALLSKSPATPEDRGPAVDDWTAFQIPSVTLRTFRISLTE